MLIVLLAAGAMVAIHRDRRAMAMTLLLLVSVVPITAYASSVTLPYSFTNGTIAEAPEVNANFEAVKTSVDDNDGRIGLLEAKFGTNTSLAVAGTGGTCTLGEVWLTAGAVASGVPAEGQVLLASEYNAMFALLGTTYGGDGRTTFALPDLRDAAPSGLTYVICMEGIFPSPS
jgi:hypothetical protein